MPSEEWVWVSQSNYLTYRECAKLGHFFEVEPWRWFRYGWRWPWRSRMWLKCQGCGIAQLLPPEQRRIRSKRVPGRHS